MRRNDACYLGMIRRRAQMLFECGYRARWISETIVEIVSPARAVYQVDTVQETCSCPFFTERSGRLGCKHLLGYLLLLMRVQQARLYLRLRCNAQNSTPRTVRDGCFGRRECEAMS